MIVIIKHPSIIQHETIRVFFSCASCFSSPFDSSGSISPCLHPSFVRLLHEKTPTHPISFRRKKCFSKLIKFVSSLFVSLVDLGGATQLERLPGGPSSRRLGGHGRLEPTLLQTQQSKRWPAPLRCSGSVTHTKRRSDFSGASQPTRCRRDGGRLFSLTVGR